MISAPAETNASNTESHNNGGLAGYIFLCNRCTKLECFRNRVFGLPLSKKQVVEEIKPGTKLFLFDFEVKLLYGVYEATSAGNLNLEPAAFGGKFPAQVKFKIFKQCLPHPESSLRKIIKENYTGTKFKQELSIEQVINLISSFRPLGASSTESAAQSPAHIYVPEEIPPEVIQNPREIRERFTRPLVEPQPVPNTSYLEQEAQIRASSRYYVAHPQPPLFTENVTLGVQEPSCSRYTTVERRAPQGHQTEPLYQYNLAANSNSTAADQYTPSVMQMQPSASYYQLPSQTRQNQYTVGGLSSSSAVPSLPATSFSHQQVPAAYLPLQREPLHQDTMSPYISNRSAQYGSAVFYPVHYGQSFLPGSQYQDRVAAYGSYPQAPGHYTASGLQPQVHATYMPPQTQAFYQEYYSNPTVPAPYTSITLPQVNARNFP